jgi:hypothetical protein
MKRMKAWERQRERERERERRKFEDLFLYLDPLFHPLRWQMVTIPRNLHPNQFIVILYWKRQNSFQSSNQHFSWGPLSYMSTLEI